MRRPQPLPTPPRREPDPTPVVEPAPAPRFERAPKRGSGRAAAPVSDADGIPTDVDLPTFDSWVDDAPAVATSSRAGAVDPDAVTDVIADDGVFASDEVTLAPVLPIAASEDAPSAPRRRPKKAPTNAGAAAPDEVSAEEAESATPTGWGDVWRASHAHRKALRREVRRFTVRSRRRRLAWIVSLSAVAVVVAGSFAVAYSPLFAVEKITVAGTSMIDAAAVQTALADEVGSPLAAIDRAAIKKHLETFPAVETYSLEARPPHELVVRIVERTPVGVVTSAGAYDLVDAAGVTLATTPEPPAGQPVISSEGGTDSAAFRAIGTVLRAVPDSIRAQVSAASATTAYDVTLTIGATGTTIIWGGADDSAEKALVLEKIMVPRPPAQVAVYDVSSPDNVIVR